jgi:LysR family glycine cleavage system transcriptional activator
MTTRLPPLNALRAFEAVARHQSFTRAAAELFVTQAAISHQIKSLEEHLGVPLFWRNARRLELTDEGHALAPFVRDAFASLTLGIDLLRERRGSQLLTVSTTPTVAAKWLIGRLGRFQALNPSFEIQLTTTPRLVDLLREGVDCGIRHGLGSWPGLAAVRLFSSEVTPVCSPVLVSGPRRLQSPQDLVRQPLIHVMDAMDDWRAWLHAAGVAGIDPERGLRLDTLPLAIEAAKSGAGVAIGPTRMFAQDLAAGTLVEPFDLELPSESAYYFVTPAGRVEVPKIRIFRDWLLEEVAADEDRRPAGVAAVSPR